jgi:hypothetical protein
VIEGVKKTEGIEITLTCNKEAFQFAIEFLKCKTDEEQDALLVEKVMFSNCLNILVTTDFLKLRNVYITVFSGWFIPHFVETISLCKLNLNTLTSRIMQDIAAKVDIK